MQYQVAYKNVFGQISFARMIRAEVRLITGKIAPNLMMSIINFWFLIRNMGTIVIDAKYPTSNNNKTFATGAHILGMRI